MKEIAVFVSWCLLVFFLLLIGGLFEFVNLGNFYKVITSDRTLFSIKLSIVAGFIATAISFCVALPVGYALSRYNFGAKGLLDALLELPIIVPPVALGALILIFLNGRIGNFIQNNIIDIVFTFWGIVVAQFVTTVGIATRLVKTTFDQVNPRYEIVASTLGAKPWQVFLHVSLPIAKRGILSALIVTYAKCLGEFGATITVAGTMPFRTETVPISIFMRLSSADLTGTSVLIMILIFVGIIILWIIRYLVSLSRDLMET